MPDKRFPAYYPRLTGRNWVDASRELEEFIRRILNSISALTSVTFSTTTIASNTTFNVVAEEDEALTWYLS